MEALRGVTVSAADRRASLSRAPRAAGALRDAEPLGHRVGAHSRLARLRGARDHERGLRLGARQARQPGDARASSSITSRSSLPRPTCRSTSTASAASPTTRAASPRPSGSSARRVRQAARSRTGTPSRGGSRMSLLAVERVAEAAEAARAFDPPLVLTGRAENHLHGVDDLDDTIARLVAYRDAGADCVYAPWLATAEQISAVVDAVGVPVNVLAVPATPPIAELAQLGVRRISTGSLLAGAAYGALAAGARELQGDGTSRMPPGGCPRTTSRRRSARRRAGLRRPRTRGRGHGSRASRRRRCPRPRGGDGSRRGS